MMKRRRHMHQKYFLRKLLHNLILITLPLFLLGFVLTLYSRGRLQQELSDYAERSKNALLDTVTNALDTFSEETALFSASPNFALSISRLLNEQSLDYRNSVYKDIIPTILGTTSNISTYVDSVYLYYENPYGNYFSSIKQYTSVSAPNSTDSEWLSLYLQAPSGTKQWACLRMVRNYSFEEPVPVVSIFRRLDAGGVIILNLNADKLSALLEAGQIYAGSCTLIADQNGALIFGSSQAVSFTENGKLSPELAVLAEEKTSPYKTADIDETTYIYYTSEIPDYDLVMISLLPDAEVFRSVHTMVLAFAFIILFSIILSFSLSLTSTLSNFRQLKTLLELFSSAEQNQALPSQFRPQTRNEYDLIFNNIIRTFVSNNLLKLNLAESKVHEKDAQLAALQLQLNPHFIFNTLQTLDLEVLKSQARENHASLLIHNLSDILKYSLENTSRQVPIREEIEICKSFAEIQKLRYRNPFLLYWDYEEEVLDLPVIHLILQPLLENSLHHGIKELPRKGLIKIRILKRNSRIHISIIDNGIGMEKAYLKSLRESLTRTEFGENRHIGIYNTNLRLILTYGPESALKIQSRAGWGTIIHFSLPAEK